MGAAERLGSLMGVVATYGPVAVQDALNACSRGEATPAQQKIVYAVVETAAK